MSIEKDPAGFEFNNVLGKLPGETDQEWIERTGQESTPLTPEEAERAAAQAKVAEAVDKSEKSA